MPVTAKQEFTRIYEQNHWANNESRSGVGSTLAATEALRRELPAFLEALKVRTVLDAACGEYHWLSQTTLPVDHYMGVDIVEPLIAANQAFADLWASFQCLDIRVDPLPKVDLILCRDALVHMSYHDIQATLRNFVLSGSTYVLMTTFPKYLNEDLRGNQIWRPLNLELPPFKLPKPLLFLNEECREDDGKYDDKGLGLWKL